MLLAAVAAAVTTIATPLLLLPVSLLLLMLLLPNARISVTKIHMQTENIAETYTHFVSLV